MARKKSITADFEKSMDQLEAIVTRMESGELSLDESLKLFEQGVELTRHCQSALQEAEEKITTLTQKNGQWLQLDTDTRQDN